MSDNGLGGSPGRHIGTLGKEGAAREKYWEEYTPEEKIERLRNSIAQLFAAQHIIRVDNAALMQHSHGASGQILCPLDKLSFEGVSDVRRSSLPYNIRTKRERGE